MGSFQLNTFQVPTGAADLNQMADFTLRANFDSKICV